MNLVFISQILNKEVLDLNGEKIGKSKDFVISIDDPFPLLKAIIIKISDKKKKNVLWENISQIEDKIKLKVGLDDITEYHIEKDDIKLAKILDMQIIDSDGKKIDRVNDIEISEIDGIYRFIGIGIGFSGLIRRLGLDNILHDLKIKIPGEYITWDQIDIPGSDEYNLKLKVTDSELKKLNPSEIADVIQELNDKDLTTILNSLDEDTAATILQEISSNRQVCIVDGMDINKTANILNKMPIDSATDLFGCTPEDKAEDILKLMNPEQGRKIRQLLNYPPDSAGGIMTTDFAVINEEKTAQEILEYLRNTIKKVNFIYYIYFVSNETLTGVASLKDIVFSDPDKRANEFMIYDLITVKELENQNDVAKKIAKYNLLAVPVINDKNEIKGIVTFDDAMDLILPSKWKNKIPRMI